MGGANPSAPGAMREALAAFAGLDGARVEALGGGLLNESYAVSSASGEYIAQRVNPIFAPGVHDNIRAVTEHLASRGESTFRLCETRAGALFVDVPEAGRWRLMERLPGVTFDTCSTPAQARSAGRRVAAFHSALVDFDAPLAPLGFPFHDTPLHLADLRDAIERHADHARAADVRRLAVDVFAAAESCRPPLDLPLRVVHGDLKFSNVLFAGPRPPGSDDAQALIDLDTVCRLPIYLDLGDALRSWCNRRVEDDPEAELDTALFAAAAAGYREGLDVALTGPEWRSFEVALENVSLELCARFATDALEESYFAWDAERFASSSEHNWARARGQWSLHQQARATAAERVRSLRD